MSLELNVLANRFPELRALEPEKLMKMLSPLHLFEVDRRVSADVMGEEVHLYIDGKLTRVVEHEQKDRWRIMDSLSDTGTEVSTGTMIDRLVSDIKRRL